MALQNKTDKNFLIYGHQILQDPKKELPPLHIKNDYCSRLWSDRLILLDNKCEENKEGAFWEFTAIDLLTNETRFVRFRKITDQSYFLRIYPIDTEYGIIIEYFQNERTWRINLIKIDWNTNEFKEIQHFEMTQFPGIITDKLNPTNFILKWDNETRDIYNYQICKIINGKFDFGEIYHIDQYFEYYSNDKLIQIHKHSMKLVIIYDLTKREKKRLEIDRKQLPGNVSLMDECEWVNERLYVSIKYWDTKNYGITCVDLEKNQWELLNFETNLFINRLKLFNGNLIVSAKNYLESNGIYQSEVKFYTVPVRRPNSLRYSAWLCVVKVMKNRGEEDPYSAAKEFLPLNSDLRPYWFKDEEKKMEQTEIN